MVQTNGEGSELPPTVPPPLLDVAGVGSGSRVGVVRSGLLPAPPDAADREKADRTES